MKIMYFAFDGFDTLNGTNHLALKMMDTFLKEGHKVHLMTSHSHGLADDIPDLLKGRENFSFDIVERSKVDKKNFIARYLDGFVYSLNAMKKWRKVKGIDAVILQSTPTVVFSSVLMKLFLKAPVVFNSYDVFPNGPYLMGAIKNKFVAAVLYFMQKIVYNNSAAIVVISEDMKNTFIKMGIKEEKLKIIPNWYDASQVKVIDVKDNKFIKQNDIDISKFYVQYAGNFGFTFYHEDILSLADMLKEESDIVFQMIGSGAFEKDFKEKAKERGLDNIQFFPWQTSDVIADVYNAASIEIVPLSSHVIYNSYPSKTSLVMACKKTFICINERESEFYEYVNTKKIGFSYSRDELEKVAEKIKQLRDNPNLLKEYEENAYKCGIEEFSSETNAKKYIEICEYVMGGK